MRITLASHLQLMLESLFVVVCPAGVFVGVITITEEALRR